MTSDQIELAALAVTLFIVACMFVVIMVRQDRLREHAKAMRQDIRHLRQNLDSVQTGHELRKPDLQPATVLHQGARRQPENASEALSSTQRQPRPYTDRPEAPRRALQGFPEDVSSDDTQPIQVRDGVDGSTWVVTGTPEPT